MTETTSAPPAAVKLPPPPPEPSSFALIATLGLAGLLSGIVLVSVYAITQPIIKQNQREALQRAILTVLPGAASFKTLADRDGKLVLLTDAEAAGVTDPCVYAGYDEAGKIAGFAIPGAEPGYQDLIHGIFGFEPGQKIIVGFQVLESRETPGLGDKIIKDDDWLKANFTALAVDPEIEAVAPGSKTGPNQVETITGATISSATVVRLMQKSITRWRPLIEAWCAEQAKGGGQ
jgi:electron transport complex protein RnfG